MKDTFPIRKSVLISKLGLSKEALGWLGDYLQQLDDLEMYIIDKGMIAFFLERLTDPENEPEEQDPTGNILKDLKQIAMLMRGGRFQIIIADQL